MESCVSRCTIGFTWWQVTILVAGVLICWLLIEATTRLLDLYEDRHRDEPIEDAADGVPLEPPEDKLSFQQWAAEPEDHAWTVRMAEEEAAEQSEPGDTIVEAEVVPEPPDDSPLLERSPAFAWQDKAEFWFIRTTLHRSTCGAVTRVRKQENWVDIAAPVPTNDPVMIARMVTARNLTVCGRCHPLS